jgi:diguanylate cyclase (GGDEF)-like protein
MDATPHTRIVTGKGPLAPTWGYRFLALGVVGVILAALPGGPADALYAGFGLAILPIAIFAIRRNQPTHLGPWRPFLGMLAFWVAGNVVSALFGDGAIADGLFLVGYVLELVTFSRILRLRQGHGHRAVLWDGLLVSAAAFLVVWITLIEPTLARSDDPILSTLLSGLYLPFGVGTVFLTFRIAFTDTFRLPSYWFFISAAVGSMLGDVLWAVAPAGYWGGAERWAAVVYVAAYACMGTALLLPSMRSLTEAVTVRTHPVVGWRLGAVAGFMLLPTLILALDSPSGPLDRTVRIVSALAVVLAGTLRVVRAVQQHSDAQESMIHAAQHDPLTGLPNRGLLVEQITAGIYSTMGAGTQIAVLFVDLDHFKRINDSLGHPAGDAVLRTVATRLRTTIGPRGYVGRISGDEFAVVLAGLRLEGEAFEAADSLLRCFEAPISLPQGDLFVTASIGVAAYPWSPELSAEELLRDADTALYRAKDSGRSCAALFDATMRERVARRLEMETALRRALDRDELRLFYQPIIELRTGRVRGFEALIRWERPDHGITSPAEFIPIAEDTGLIVPIGNWVLLTALNQLQQWIESGVCPPDASMSVNVSPRQLRDERIVPVVVEAISRSGVAPEHLWLEVTESLMMSDPVVASSVLGRLCHLGVNVAIDDFGTGYSSLSHLKRYPIQRIKIDRSFISGLEEDEEDRSLVRTIVGMARSLGQDVVAEGIETPGQLHALAVLGCDFAQGFLFSRPVPAEQVASTVANLTSDPHLPRVPHPVRRLA